MIRLRLLFFLAFTSLSFSLFAQSGEPKITKTPLGATVVLRDIEDVYVAEVHSLEAPEPDGEQEQAAYRLLKEKVSKLFPHKTDLNNPFRYAKTTAVNVPIIIRGFVPDSNAATPPDNSIAISNSNIGLNAMNSRLATLNTATSSITDIKSLGNFSYSLGFHNIVNDGKYDPKVVYDAENDRFICVILNGTNQYNNILFGFSQTNDPSGAWNLYSMYGNYANDTTWFDYPILTITHNELFLTGNKLVYNGTFQAGFRRSLIYEIRKADGYAGNTLTSRIWDAVNFGGAPIRNIFPVNGGSKVIGPAQYFLSLRNMDVQNDSIFIIKIGDTIGSAGNVLSVAAYKSNLKYGFPPNGRQLGTTTTLQTNDARILGAFSEGNEIQFASTSLQPGSGAAAIYHGRISNYTTSPSIQANFITVDSLDFAYPNLSYGGLNGGQNSAIISFDYSGPNKYAGLGAVLWDGSGYSPLLEVKTGTDNILAGGPPVARWGDYSGSQPVYNQLGYVWIAGIHGRPTGRYGIWSALLKSPFATAVPNLASTSLPSQLYPNPAIQFIRLGFSLKAEAVLHFALYSLNGTRIDSILDAKCEQGKNEIQFNIASLAPGHYFLKGMSADGRAVVTKTFVKQ